MNSRLLANITDTDTIPHCWGSDIMKAAAYVLLLKEYALSLLHLCGMCPAGVVGM